MGLPYNTASYAALLLMLAQQFDFVPGELVLNLGDAHIYLNQEEGVREQLTREPYPLPTLKLNPEKKSIFDFVYEDFELVDYQAHPTIKFPISV